MSSKDFVLEAQPREDVGKGASRRLRHNEEIPAIIYGGQKAPLNITIQHKHILHAIENEAFFSQIITINVGKDSEKAIIKALQRHPAKPRVLHADFMRVSADQPITVRVPLHFLNRETCVGVKQSHGVVSQLLNELEVSCLPKDLPQFIEVDVAELDVGDALHISDLKLPEGVTSVDLAQGESGDHGVVSVYAEREEEAEEDSDGEEAPAEKEQDASDKEKGED